ncbi:prepilin peptidase [Vibrio ishigakensis]|uniref:prepilin peptidase n=1 Tax=Vibrio ishigakensis TaxID=1481914 RepID=UPI0021C3B20F|nr:A24 family peptidase [Vibrio ishigakensis]
MVSLCYMEISISVWTLIVVIAVEDLRHHRIPNVYLVLILGVSGLTLVSDNASPLDNLFGFVAMFTIGMFLFLVRAMSPGDVKLLGVVGFVVGWPHVFPAAFWILLSSGLLGGLVVLSNLSRQGVENPLLCLLDVRSVMESSRNDLHSVYGNKLTMPFAPAVALGLAIFYYFF